MLITDSRIQIPFAEFETIVQECSHIVFGHLVVIARQNAFRIVETAPIISMRIFFPPVERASAYRIAEYKLFSEQLAAAVT